MLKWIEILKRLLELYHVRTQAELGMAMGVPVNIGIGDHAENLVIPWPLLEKAVLEKKVSWDWLLAGRGPMTPGQPAADKQDDKKAAADADAQEEKKSGPPPNNLVDDRTPRGAPVLRVETRELARQLLDRNPDDALRQCRRDLASASGEGGDAGRSRAEVAAQLREIKENMLQEIVKVDRLLEENGGA